jgi:multicomponent Na+:H+ antiporter subunit D
LMATYGVFYAILENNLRRILCFQSIFQLGLVLVGVGLGTTESIVSAKLLIFSHVIYNTLLLIITGIFIDNSKIEKCTEISEIRITTKPLAIGGFIGVLSLMSFPYTSPFFAKTVLGKELLEYSDLAYLLYISLSSVIVLSLPWKQLFSASYINQKNLSQPAKTAIYSITIICFISGLVSVKLLKLYNISLATHSIADQFLINFTSLGLIFLLAHNEHKSKSLLLTFDYFYRKIPWENIKEINFEASPEFKNNLKEISTLANIKFRKFSNKVTLLSSSSFLVTFGLILIIAYLMPFLEFSK